ncbi:MAG: hypothetical protein ACFFCS_19015, partial [Candidatus Hodarchaeota archaeon]
KIIKLKKRLNQVFYYPGSPNCISNYIEGVRRRKVEYYTVPVFNGDKVDLDLLTKKETSFHKEILRQIISTPELEIFTDLVANLTYKEWCEEHPTQRFSKVRFIKDKLLPRIISRFELAMDEILCALYREDFLEDIEL